MAKRFALIAFLFLIPALARADSVWSFTGELTNPGSWHGDLIQPNCNCTMTGITLFDNSFDVLAYSWTDGTTTVNQNNSTMMVQYFPPGTRNIGGILETAPLQMWDLSITAPGFYFSSIEYGPGQGATSMNQLYDGSLFGWGQPNGGPDGVWTELVSTPEPSSLISLLLGLAALGLTICIPRARLTFSPSTNIIK